MYMALEYLLEGVFTQLMGNKFDLRREVVATVGALKHVLWFFKVFLTIGIDFNILPVETDVLLDLFYLEVVAAVVIMAWGRELVDFFKSSWDLIDQLTFLKVVIVIHILNWRVIKLLYCNYLFTVSELL